MVWVQENMTILTHYENTHPQSILQVPTTQLAKTSIDPKFVELTAGVLKIFLFRIRQADERVVREHRQGRWWRHR